jgi:hypothetical protein
MTRDRLLLMFAGDGIDSSTATSAASKDVLMTVKPTQLTIQIVVSGRKKTVAVE